MMANPFDKFDEKPKSNPFDRFDAQRQQSQETSLWQDIKQGAGDVLAGGVRGAGSIGATILSPLDWAARKLNDGRPVSVGGFDILGHDRRAGMDAGLREMGANPESGLYQTGKLAGEIAGTAGAGGAVANVLGRAVPALANAPLLQAIRTSGMSTGVKGAPLIRDMATRMAGGSVAGGVGAGMVNPEDASTGATFGAALPPSLKVAGKVGSLAKKATSGLAKHTIGLTTGAGGETFSTAYKAGKEGGTNFLENMRGNVPMTDVLDSAKDALSKMRIDRGNQYRSGMIDISNDKSIIDFAPIEKAAQSLKTMGSFKGQVINKNAAGTVDEISETINNWKNLDPAEYHTPEGLDALKKSIGDIRDAAQFGTPSRKAADTAYNAVKAQIESQAPTYSKVMKDYSQASQTISEIEKALSLGNKASADTSMRKLQSLMRNNVNTNYGNRLDLARKLEEQGADILPAIAGQSASSIMPRGLQGVAASGMGAASFFNPTTLAALPFTSPRLMGEVAYGLGTMNRGVGNVVSRIPIPQALISNTQGGLLGQPQQVMQQFGYQAAPVVFSR